MELTCWYWREISGLTRRDHNWPIATSAWRVFSPLTGWPTPVVFVPGNHEYDALDFDIAHARLRETCERLGMIWLERESTVLGGRAVCGHNPVVRFRCTGPRPVLHQQPLPTTLWHQSVGTTTESPRQSLSGRQLLLAQDTDHTPGGALVGRRRARTSANVPNVAARGPSDPV
jgi:hypothetical protein